MGETLVIDHSEAKFLFIYEPVKYKNQAILFQNTVVKQA